MTDLQAKYDKQVKKLLANEAILAWILKTCTEEFSSLELEQIVRCIDGKPEVAMKAVHAIDLDADEAEGRISSDKSIEGLNTEDVSLKEQSVYYDIRFNAKVPGDDSFIELIINIEAQLNPSPGYPIEKRAIYYCCRLISSQYGSIFTHSEYGKIRKVYSIWFCPDPAQKRRNTIKRISLTENPLYGEPDTCRQDVDLLQAVIVNLGDPESDMDNQILRLMNVLLSSEKTAEEKKKVMQDEFHIAMTVNLESEVSELCNLSLGIYNEGLEAGMEKGMEEGMEKGMEKGIIISVKILRKRGVDDADIVSEIMDEFQLTRKEAEGYVFAPTAV